MEYLAWQNDIQDEYCYINKCPSDISDDKWMLTEGASCKDWFPDDLVFDLDPDSGIKIPDSIPNSLNIHIVSEKLKSILESESQEYEFFPITIKNAKGKKVAKTYYVANLLTKISCTDLKQSKYVESCLDKGQFASISKLVLDEKKIPEGTPLFRLGEMTELVLVSKELAIKIKRENGCTGALFVFLTSYSG